MGKHFISAVIWRQSALMVLLAAHTWYVKLHQLALKGNCRGSSRQTPGEMETCLSQSFLGSLFILRSKYEKS